MFSTMSYIFPVNVDPFMMSMNNFILTRRLDGYNGDLHRNFNFVPSHTRTLQDSAYQWHASLNSIRWLDAQNKNNFLKGLGDLKCWLSALIPIPSSNSQVICCKVTFDMPHYLLKFPQNFVPAQTLLKIWNIDSILPFHFTVQKPVWQTKPVWCTFTKTGAILI